MKPNVFAVYKYREERKASSWGFNSAISFGLENSVICGSWSESQWTSGSWRNNFIVSFLRL